MKTLKSLNSFEREESSLTRKQMQSVMGGSEQTQMRETCVNNVEDSEVRGRKDAGDCWTAWGSWVRSSCTVKQLVDKTC